MPLGKIATLPTNGLKNALHGYRWKGRLLRSLLLAKFEDPSSAAAPLDAFSKAMKIRADGLRRGQNVASYPTSQAVLLICKELKHSWVRKAKGSPSRNIDIVRYERFQNELGDISVNEQITETELARSWLYHPTAPSPDPMLRYWKGVFNDPTHARNQPIVSPRNQQQANTEYSRLVQTASLLLYHERHEEADWLISKIERHHPPRLTRYLAGDLAQAQGGYRRVAAAQSRERQLERPTSSRQIPFPSFRLSPT